MSRSSDKIFIFDSGPPKPVAPVAPPHPVGVEGEATFELQKLGYRLAVADYNSAMGLYEPALAEWRKYEAGPIRLSMTLWDANEAIANDERAVREGRQAGPRYHRTMP